MQSGDILQGDHFPPLPMRLEPPVFGALPAGNRLERIIGSPNYRDGTFQNPVKSSTMLSGSLMESLKRQFLGKEERVPHGHVPVVTLSRGAFDIPPASGLRVTWMGHSSVLIEIDGSRVLVDPVWGKRASPSQLVGPKRFHPTPIALADLPPLDAVIITHDHYDHLDMHAVRALLRSPAQQRVQWVTTLGVGAHLERWKVPVPRITELDWGDAALVGSLRMTAQPARHFSGRTLVRDRTLWASWVIAGPEHRVFHSGDTGYFDALADIGTRHGPFDLTMIKIGAYGESWPDIHLDPEQAVRVHGMLGGRVLLPIHWGTFNLAFHAWTEPPERLLAAAEPLGMQVVIPTPGQFVEPAVLPPIDRWWSRVG
ncbi:MAG: fold metallo-hydrolase [Gemmatimonadetes bacterium]|nr:fold metallo-hydrolase [Gemmatimonadota bacterium]